MAKTIRTSAEQITRLRTYNIVAGVMHLLQAVAFGYFLSRIENQVTFDATVDYMTGPPGAGFPTEKVVLWEVNLGLGVVAFLALSAFFHFLISSPWFFKRYAAGDGLRAIAGWLNTRGLRSPHAGRRGTGTWATSTIKAMLRNERYRGVIVWGRVGWVYKHGTRVMLRRPPGEWTRVERPELAIVDAATWAAVGAVLEGRQRLTGSTHRGARARYLLSGFARCGACGGPLQAADYGTGGRRRAYVCSWARDRGPAVCTATARREVGEVDRAVVGWITAHALRDDVVTEQVDRAANQRSAPAVQDGLFLVPKVIE